MRTTLGLSAAALALALASCEHDKYAIEMTPQGDRMLRKITVSHTGSDDKPAPVAQEQIDAVQKFYETRLTEPDALEHTFEGAFRRRLPADIGGAGYYLHYVSRMGAASVYSERVRGRDDQAGLVAERMAQTDRCVDHLVAWFARQLVDAEGLGALRTWMDTDLRRDLKNLVLNAWMAQAGRVWAAEQDPGQQMTMRSLQYLAERGYFAPEEVPQVSRAVMELVGPKSSARLFFWIRRVIATKMGVPRGEPVPESLAFLADMETAKASLEAYLRGTDEFKRQLQDWEEAKKTDAEAEEPDPWKLVAVPNTLPLNFGFGDKRDDVGASLVLGVEPWLTNGTPDAEKKRLLRCNTRMAKEGDAMPPVWYAMWTHPDEAFQMKHFGKAVLAGSDLHWYCIWRAGLTEGEAKEWDAFVDGLEPGPELKDALEAFRFSGEPATPREGEDKPPPSHAAVAVDLITSNLSAEADEKQQAQPGAAP